MEYLVVAILIVLSALFSGLTLGLLSLDVQTLKRRAKMGDTAAAALYPLRRRGNLLLTTLLLGNVIINTTLSIFLGSLLTGVAAVIVATTLIFLFGEILPQAVISRHALSFGGRMAPFVRVVMLLLYPLAYPIAWMLDRLLGDEVPTLYSKQEIMEIISEHEDSEHSPIDEDEERIVHGALQFSHRTVAEVMTPREEVVMFPEEQVLTDAFFEHIAAEGYSRYPIFRGDVDTIVGILYAKDLLTEDESIAIRDTEEALDTNMLRVRTTDLLDAVLAAMLKKRKHMGIVYDEQGTFSGVITLEDIIEEIIQYEIEDEDDAEKEG